MALIQNPSIGRKLMRALRLTSLPDSVLAIETVPVILVEDLSAPLADIERGCAGTANIGAVVGENSFVSLVRVGAPATYSMIVRKVWFSLNTTDRITIGIPTAGLTGITANPNTSFLDLELAGRPTSQLGIGSDVAIPAHRAVWRGRVLANTTYKFKVNIKVGTIGLGDSLTSVFIVAEAQNLGITAGFEWVEGPPEG